MKDQKNKRSDFYAKFVFDFIFMVFNIIIASAVIIGAAFYLGFRLNLFYFRGPLGTLFILLLTSILVGTAVCSFFGFRTLRPIKELSLATKKIAEGDFKVKIEEIPIRDNDSELNELIRNFNEMAARLSEVETLRSDFIADVSHEFKTPLATIQGYVTLLEDDSLTVEERKKYQKIIFDATSKLTNLTTNILNLSKLENDKVTLHYHEFDLGEQIRESIIMLQSMWESKNIEFDLTLDNLIINSDEELLQNVWQNIISNAIKFSENNSKITIFGIVDNNEIKISIQDEGIGMSKETIQRVFDKFYQGDKSRSKEGNGLGLALTYRIVKLLKGKIAVDSKINEGTTFTVSLPKN